MRGSSIAAGLAGGLFLFAPTALRGQDDPAKLEFEVASVRLSSSLPANIGPAGTISGGPGTSDPGRITFLRVPLILILVTAFGVEIDQIKGPDWVLDRTAATNEKYDIVAKVPPDATKEQVSVMMQNLLKKRLNLTVHIEKKNFDAYQLVVATGGPKLKESEPPPKPGTPTARGLDKDGFAQLPAGRTNSITVGNLEHMRVTSRMMTIAKLLDELAILLGSNHLVDRTGLTGKYDFKLEFALVGSPGMTAVNPSVAGQHGVNPIDNLSDPVPDLFTALEKQLGLKLEKIKSALLDVIVIDHIEKTPTDN